MVCILPCLQVTLYTVIGMHIILTIISFTIDHWALGSVNYNVLHMYGHNPTVYGEIQTVFFLVMKYLVNTIPHENIPIKYNKALLIYDTFAGTIIDAP